MDGFYFPVTLAVYFLAFLDWSKKWCLQLMLAEKVSLPTVPSVWALLLAPLCRTSPISLALWKLIRKRCGVLAATNSPQKWLLLLSFETDCLDIALALLEFNL